MAGVNIYILPQTPSEDGQYQSLQEWPRMTPPDGYYWWPDSLDRSTFDQYQGFVVLDIQRNTVAGYQPNAEAYEAWKASQPDPEPTDAEVLNTLLGVSE